MVRLPPSLRPLFPYLKPLYTVVTRWTAGASIGLSRRFGDDAIPAASVATTEQAVLRAGGTWRLARAAEKIGRAAPVEAGPYFAPFLNDTAPRTGVAELPGGRVLGPHRALITGTGELVQDLSYYFGTTHPREHPLYLHPFPPPARNVAGRLGVLATRGDANYYHFLMDVLPRLKVLAECGDVEPVDAWYVPRTSAFQAELLDAVGITTDRIINSDEFPHVRADTLVVPTPPSMTVVNPPWVVRHLRAALLDGPVGRIPGHRIYVSRGSTGNNRTIVNEPELTAMLTRRGYEIVDPGRMAVSEQIRTFAQASVVVAAHGAALANLAFASPGAAVVELFPAGNMVVDYWKLACGVAGLEYRYLLGLGKRRGLDRSRMLVSDICVDLERLAITLDDIEAGR